MGEHRGAWLVRALAASGWIFAGTGCAGQRVLERRDRDRRRRAELAAAALSVIAEIPNLFGARHDAQMTYYETPAGAKVFAAGAFSLAGSVRQPAVVRLLANLWARMADERS